MYGITRDAADNAFSQYIRLRDSRCVRCGSEVVINDKGLPVSHQASHYFGRGKESTRFDPENVDTLCAYCHKLWGGEEREEYKAFKIEQLGQRGFDLLMLRSNTYQKKDRKMSLIIARQLLKQQIEQK